MTEERARERLFSQDKEPADPKVILVENNGDIEDLKKELYLKLKKSVEK